MCCTRSGPCLARSRKGQQTRGFNLQGVYARVGCKVGGNKYRVVLAIDYERQFARIRLVGTHAQYDLIDAESI